MKYTNEQHEERLLQALSGALRYARVLYNQDFLSAYSVATNYKNEVFARDLNGHWTDVTTPPIPLPVTAPRGLTAIDPVLQAQQDVVRQSAAILRGWGHPAPFEEVVAGVKEVFEELNNNASQVINITNLLHRYRRNHSM